MRYKSPARSSYRDNRTYETLTTRSSYSTVDRGGMDGPNVSDDSFEQLTDKTNKSGDKSRKATTPITTPWSETRGSPQQTTIPADNSYTFNIIGETRGVTVI